LGVGANVAAVTGAGGMSPVGASAGVGMCVVRGSC
jgi:hypothetical protein